MSSFAANRREERLNAVYSVSELITEQKYNIVLCGAVLWGLIINFILCITVGNVYEYINPIPFFIGYFVLVIAGSLIASKSDNAVVSFIGYNMIVLPIGLVVSTVVELYGGVQSTVVAEAFLITMCVTAVMALFAVTKPDLVATIGGILFPCLIGLIVAEVVVLLLGYNNNIFSWIGAALFSLYIAYDNYRSQQFTKTVDNAVDCAVDIYLDITALFLRILRIVGGRSRN